MENIFFLLFINISALYGVEIINFNRVQRKSSYADEFNSNVFRTLICYSFVFCRLVLNGSVSIHIEYVSFNKIY